MNGEKKTTSNYVHSTHYVHRGPESLPCYCAASSDHSIGQEQPHKRTAAPRPKAIEQDKETS